MARVNVMTAISNNTSPAKMQRVGMWLVEVIGEGEPVTHDGMLIRESISGQELTLQLLANALTKLKNMNIEEMESIEMYLDYPIIESVNKWLERWSKEEWKTAKGKDIADKDTWILIWNLLTVIGKRYIASDSPSRYHSWMYFQIRNEVKKIHDREVAEESIRKIHEKLA